jgi:hypothetical protein
MRVIADYMFITPASRIYRAAGYKCLSIAYPYLLEIILICHKAQTVISDGYLYQDRLRKLKMPIFYCNYACDLIISGMPSCSSGLGFFLFSSFCLVACTAFSCKKFIT